MPLLRPSAWTSARRGAVRLTLGAALAAAAFLSLGYAAIVSGIGEERLRVEAQSAFDALLGEGLDARIAGVRVSFDGTRMLALDVSDTRILSAGTETEFLHVGSVRFGLRPLPLARGDVQVASMRLGDARIDLSGMPLAGGPGLAIFDDRGLLDPDAALAALFDAAGRLFDTLGRREVDRIELDDVEVVLPMAVDGERMLHVAGAVLERGDRGALRLTARLGLGDREATVEGEATREADGAIGNLALRIDAPKAAGELDVGAVRLELAGAQQDGVDRARLAARIGESVVPTGRDSIAAALTLDASMQSGTGKLEIDRLRVASGRSFWEFHGAVGPVPASGMDDGDPAYRFEMVSDGSALAPDGTSEPVLEVGARLAGLVDAGGRTVHIDEIGVRSGDGEVRGDATVRFEPGTSPGLTLNLAVDDMPVGQVKQLWPWFAARGTRNWVLANVYGGRVEKGLVRLDAAAGRLTDNVPLGPDEVSGSFAIRDTRFDVAGTMPPVREGNGTVDFSGTDVDIALESGSMFMPGGRTVTGRDGSLAIRDSHIHPIMGALQIEVAGTADAMLQLARYEPIAVGRFIDIDPDDISGDVAGTVTATIPLERDVAREQVDWQVRLDYQRLALATPFHGQTVTDATGSITVDPEKAVIDARANLNGMPATVQLVEPLHQEDLSQRRRRVAMQMDDKARNAIAPGLDALLTGTTQVELDEAAPEKRVVKATLDGATLTIPWVGWSKGSGVPASVGFAMATSGERTQLSDFQLRGETFGATGSLTLDRGELVNARFSSARLNRHDDFSLDVKSAGQGYTVTVRGRSIDARSVVELYRKGTTSGGASAGGKALKIDLAVDAMSGFHNEVLRDVSFVYSGTGTRTDLLQFSATTASGQPIRLKDEREGKARAISINSGDAGAVLRFLGVYERMEGGSIKLALNGTGSGPLSGVVDARDFWLVDEPRLRSIVSTPATGDGRSLNETLRQRVDTQRVHFERGYSRIVKDDDFLSLDRGILRGPVIGATFQGVLYDQKNNMAMTGTFMPAYGFNRLFGEIPLIGRILGNGRDRGLIGITFRLAGKAAEPQLQVNPLSVIAPGIFRSVFEFR